MKKPLALRKDARERPSRTILTSLRRKGGSSLAPGSCTPCCYRPSANELATRSPSPARTLQHDHSQVIIIVHDPCLPRKLGLELGLDHRLLLKILALPQQPSNRPRLRRRRDPPQTSSSRSRSRGVFHRSGGRVEARRGWFGRFERGGGEGGGALAASATTTFGRLGHGRKVARESRWV